MGYTPRKKREGQTSDDVQNPEPSGGNRQVKVCVFHRMQHHPQQPPPQAPENYSKQNSLPELIFC